MSLPNTSFTTAAEAWESFLDHLYPNGTAADGVSEAQVDIMKQSFYAGLVGGINVLNNITEQTPDVDAAARRVDGVLEEIMIYGFSRLQEHGERPQ